MAVQKGRGDGEFEDRGPGVAEVHDAVEDLFAGVGDFDLEDGDDCWGKGGR